MSSLSEKVAIITGGGKGTGLGIARASVKEGVAVVLTGRTLATLEDAKSELEALAPGARVLVLSGDGKDHAVPADVVARTIETFGRLDILVNNAQEFRTVIPFEDTTWDDMIVTYESGIFATVRYMQAALPYLKQTQGTVINMGSGAGSQSLPNHLAYGSNKEAIRSASRIAAREWGRFGITVNVISPFVMSAELQRWQEVHLEELRAVLATVPLGRFGDAELNVGSLCVYLAKEEGKYMTGSTFDVEGGAFVRP